MSAPLAFKISPGIQTYDWGKRGSHSLAAQLASTSVPDFKVDDSKTYAELWMGTHPTLPAKVPSGLLADFLRQHPDLIGDEVANKFPNAKDGSLPFLFKVLSIGTALSIQAHPDKTLAERLFQERPDIYKGNMKLRPEMAIALTPFLAFLNFLPLPLLLGNLTTVPELADLIPASHIAALAKSLETSNPSNADNAKVAPNDHQKGALKDVFASLMTAPEHKVQVSIERLIKRYKSHDFQPCEASVVDLAIMLDSQYPGDVGVLCVFFLNVVKLERGEAAFLGANVPHAYISGDIIECMATSDNVVRAGLTPKLRDVETLVSMLSYNAGPASAQLLAPVAFDESAASMLYDPPIHEFSVLGITLAADAITSQRPIAGPSIAVITMGEAEISWLDKELSDAGLLAVTRGDVIFLAANVEYKWTAIEGLEAFRAFVEA